MVQVGTPGYMAPEMARDEPYDQSADIFSFGLLLYELIAQQRAWSGQDIPHFGASGAAARVDEDNPKSMADLVPHLLEVRGTARGWGTSLDRANFRGLVLGCIEAKICK